MAALKFDGRVALVTGAGGGKNLIPNTALWQSSAWMCGEVVGQFSALLLPYLVVYRRMRVHSMVIRVGFTVHFCHNSDQLIGLLMSRCINSVILGGKWLKFNFSMCGNATYTLKYIHVVYWFVSSTCKAPGLGSIPISIPIPAFSDLAIPWFAIPIPEPSIPIPDSVIK